MKRKLALYTTVLALTGVALYSTSTVLAQNESPAPAAPAAPKEHKERHPAIHGAIRALEHAKVDLQHANHDFGGHREAALKECDAAIAQLKLALQYDKQ
jgi:hypothetical protein